MNVEKILAPIELSSVTPTVVHSSTHMAGVYGASIVFLHVFEPVLVRKPMGYDRQKPSPKEFDSIKELVTGELDRLLTDDEKTGLTIEVQVLCGDPFEKILEAVEDIKAGLIVMGTHGRRGLSHMFLGSVAEKIVRMAPCPVLTVKPPEDGQ